MCWPEKPYRCVSLLCACSCEPSLTFDLLKQEQWIPTKSEIKLTMMRMRIWDMIQMKMNDLQKTQGVTHNKNNNKNESFHPNLFAIHLPQQNQLPGQMRKMKKLPICPKLVTVCGRGFSSISSDLLIAEGTGWPEAVISCHESLVWY